MLPKKCHGKRTETILHITLKFQFGRTCLHFPARISERKLQNMIYIYVSNAHTTGLYCWYNEIIILFSHNIGDNDENNTEDLQPDVMKVQRRLG